MCGRRGRDSRISYGQLYDIRPSCHAALVYAFVAQIRQRLHYVAGLRRAPCCTALQRSSARVFTGPANCHANCTSYKGVCQSCRGPAGGPTRVVGRRRAAGALFTLFHFPRGGLRMHNSAEAGEKGTWGEALGPRAQAMAQAGLTAPHGSAPWPWHAAESLQRRG